MWLCAISLESQEFRIRMLEFPVCRMPPRIGLLQGEVTEQYHFIVIVHNICPLFRNTENIQKLQPVMAPGLQVCNNLSSCQHQGMVNEYPLPLQSSSSFVDWQIHCKVTPVKNFDLVYSNKLGQTFSSWIYKKYLNALSDKRMNFSKNFHIFIIKKKIGKIVFWNNYLFVIFWSEFSCHHIATDWSNILVDWYSWDSMFHEFIILYRLLCR